MRIRLLLLLLLALPLMAVSAAPAVPPPVEGIDYVVIAPAQPYAPLAGRIEVAEVFGYWCSHCAEFQPKLSAWKHTLPADVRVTYVPAVFTAGDAFARAYFAARHFGVLDRTHEAMFIAIHSTGELPSNASVDELATYLGQHGLDARKAKAYMHSAAVDAQLEHARQFALHGGVEGTPTLIINGRYRVTARTHTDGLRVASQLIAQLRAEAHRPRTPPPQS
jgi:protein dithiol oxidoreductase (disulfide-forming)